MSFSNYLEEKIIKHLLGIAAYTAPDIYVALSTADPGEDGSGIAEPAGNNYSRVSAASWTWDAGDARGENSAAVDFPQASGSWGEITHFALFDASSAGNLLGSAALLSSKTIGSGDTLSFATGDLSIAMD